MAEALESTGRAVLLSAITTIIGFISFFLMVVFGVCDLITAFWGQDLLISDTIYTSFVVVTLGAFGISEAGKAFGKQ